MWNFIGLGVLILGSAWLVQWAKRFSREQDLRAVDLADFSTMELSKDERHAVAEILQVRMVR